MRVAEVLMSSAIEIRLTGAKTFETRKKLGRIFATNSSAVQIIQGSGDEGGALNRESRILDMDFAVSKHAQFRLARGVTYRGLALGKLVAGRSASDPRPRPTARVASESLARYEKLRPSPPSTARHLAGAQSRHRRLR